MTSVEVGGVRVPVTVAGHVGLELCNTRAGWGAPNPKEYLLSYEHLAVWAHYAGLTPTVTRAPAARGAAVLRRVVAFREEFYAALTDGKPDWAVLDAETRRLELGLAPTPDGETAARWDIGEDAEAPLRAAVFGALGVLTSPVSRNIRACPGVGCGWLFHDPRGRRRWCVMAVCGNRAKAARHAELVRATARRPR
jgi:predicted RNA-binding Zn ribbon-like protein